MKRTGLLLALLILLMLLTACGNDFTQNDVPVYNSPGTGAFFGSTPLPSTAAETATAIPTANPTLKVTPAPSLTAASALPSTTARTTSAITTADPTLKVTPAPSLTAASAAKTWQNISPPNVSTDPDKPATNYGFQTIVLDPSNGAIYVGTCYQGLWKSADQGKSWLKVNTGTNSADLDSGRLWTVAIDPVNPQILYTTAGYGAGGILKSTNGGRDWINMIPNGSTVQNTVNSQDIYSIAIDPANHNHILAAFHSVQGAGQYFGNAPVIESLDAGATWTVHKLPELGYTHYIFFLDNSTTWLLGTQQKGFWRTTDSGKTWQQVSTNDITDGGASLYKSNFGAWYTTSTAGVLRSVDGTTWTQVNSQKPIYAVIGDGTNLYTQQAYSGTNVAGSASYSIASEATGTNWVVQNSQKFSDGPMSMAYDAKNHIIYSSNWRAGVWKLEVGSNT